MVTGAERSYGRRWLDAARHPARRDGAVLWALLVLPWVGRWPGRRHHHLDTGGWALVLTVSLGLPTLWVTWATFRDARRSGAAGAAWAWRGSRTSWPPRSARSGQPRPPCAA